MQELLNPTTNIIEYNLLLKKAIKSNNKDSVISILSTLKSSTSQSDLVNILNLKYLNDYTLLQQSILIGNIDVIELLIENGCHFPSDSDDISLIHLACYDDNLRLCIYLIEKYNLNPNQSKSKSSDMLPIQLACSIGSEACVKYLITKLDDINIVDSLGNSLLHLASYSKRNTLIKFLIIYGVDSDLRNVNNKQAIDICYESNYIEGYKSLKSNGRCEMFNVNKFSKRSLYKNVFNIIFFFTSLVIVNFFMFNSVLNLFQTFLPFFIFIFFNFLLLFIYISLLIINPNDNTIFNGLRVNLLHQVTQGKSINHICFICLIKYSSTTTHCVICKECVLEFNHHCFWINKCIGKKNIYIFYLFLLVLLCNLILNMVITYEIISYKDVFLLERTVFLYNPMMFGMEVEDYLVFIYYFIYFLFVFSLVVLVPVVYLMFVHVNNELSSEDKKLKCVSKYNKTVNDVENCELKENLI